MPDLELQQTRGFDTTGYKLEEGVSDHTIEQLQKSFRSNHPMSSFDEVKEILNAGSDVADIVEKVCEDGKFTVMEDGATIVFSLPELVQDFRIAIETKEPIVFSQLTQAQRQEVGGAAFDTLYRIVTNASKLFKKQQ